MKKIYILIISAVLPLSVFSSNHDVVTESGTEYMVVQFCCTG